MAESNHNLSTSPRSSRDSVNLDLQISKRAVPRFTSFKPRQATADREQDDHVSGKSRSKSSGKGDHRHAEARQDRHRRHQHERYAGKEKTEENHAEPALNTQFHRHIPSSGPDVGNVGTKDLGFFSEDRQGDENNIRYGTMHRYSVPKYYEAGRFRVLGLPRQLKTSCELEPGRRLVTSDHLDMKSRLGVGWLRTSLLKESDFMPVVPQVWGDAEVDTCRNYLPLSPHYSRKRRKFDTLHIPANRLPQIDRHNNAQRFAEVSDLESLSRSSDSEPEHASVSTPIDSARERHVHLSRRVDEDPTDVDAWLALIQHQDLMLVEGADEKSQESLNAQRRGLVDIKLSMYEKALLKTKDHPLQDRLVQGMMTEASKFWDTKKLSKEWSHMLQRHPHSLDLWIHYLTFRQTSFVTFTYDGCREIFKDCLDMMATRKASALTDNTRIHIFLRMTLFMRDAGFSEHAHALWQAILEYCFFEPNSEQANHELSSFEDFWDSEVPRLGEEGAQGWRMSQRGQVEPRSQPSLLKLTDGPLLTTWAVREQERMDVSILPARTLDEVAEDDPYRVILFSDIQPFLFVPTGAEAQKQLLQAFLGFCGLPVFRWGGHSNDLPFTDTFLSNSFLDLSRMTLEDWFITPEQNGPSPFPIPSFAVDTGSLFANTKHWFDAWEGLRSVLLNRVRSEWIQRSLRQLLTAFPHDGLLAEYYIAFQSRLDVKEARKCAKSLLKQQSSVRLYNAFALLECSAEMFEAAERVWSTALCMRSSFSETSLQDVILLWRSWLWTLLDRHDFSRALRLCLAIPEEKIKLQDLCQPGMVYLEEHPTSKLRAHQHLTSFLNQNLSLGNPELSIHYLDVLSLLTYLTSNHTLPPSLAHYGTTSTHPTITQSSTALCLLHQSRARLLHLHAKSSPSGHRPSDVTSPLAESIRLFPDNTIFLSLYHFHTRRSLPIDRIRNAIPTLTASSPKPLSSSAPTPAPFSSIIPTLFHIWTELNRPTFTDSSSTAHSIRSAFEEAVSNPQSPSAFSTQHSAIIWKLYILWIIHDAGKSPQPNATDNGRSAGKNKSLSSTPAAQTQPQPGKPGAAAVVSHLRLLLHRAIRACPWNKGLYMLGFTGGVPATGPATCTTPDGNEGRDDRTGPGTGVGMAEDELRALYDMMVEKGLRLHLELPERLKEV